MKKRLILAVFLLGIFIMAGLLSGCGGASAQSQTTAGQGQVTSSGPGNQVFTSQDLANYDGQNGNPAYVAVDGVVYDVTDSSLWPDGQHTPCNLGAMAGKDLSQVIKAAPANMRDQLRKFPVVGSMS
jgi:predicted heme/steroid binding protein